MRLAESRDLVVVVSPRLFFSSFVYVYVVIVNKHRTGLWITGDFVEGSKRWQIDNPLGHGRRDARNQGQLFAGESDGVLLRFRPQVASVLLQKLSRGRSG